MSLFATGSWAGETVKIGALLSDPAAYNMKLVTVSGVVRNHRLEHFIGNVSGMEKCYQYFKVADETGAIDVSHPSICKMGNQEVVILADGDRVTVEANFAAPVAGAKPSLVVRSITKN